MKRYSTGGNDCLTPVLNMIGMEKGTQLSKSSIYSGGVIDEMRKRIKKGKLRITNIILEKQNLRDGDICLFSFRRSKIPHHFGIFSKGEILHNLPGSKFHKSWIDWKSFCFGLRGGTKWD